LATLTERLPEQLSQQLEAGGGDRFTWGKSAWQADERDLAEAIESARFADPVWNDRRV
jgi:hypothetical protein